MKDTNFGKTIQAKSIGGSLDLKFPKKEKGEEENEENEEKDELEEIYHSGRDNRSVFSSTTERICGGR